MHALGWVRRSFSQPQLLGRPGLAGHELAVGVQGDQVPAPDVVGVVALGRVAGGRAEVGEVAGRVRGGRAVRALRILRLRVVLVVAGDGMDDRRVHPPPGERVGGLERPQAAALVLVVAQRQHTRQRRADEQIRGLERRAPVRRAVAAMESAGGRVAGDVAGSGDHRVAGREGRRRGIPRRGGAGRRRDGETKADEPYRQDGSTPASKMTHPVEFTGSVALLKEAARDKQPGKWL